MVIPRAERNLILALLCCRFLRCRLQQPDHHAHPAGHLGRPRSPRGRRGALGHGLCHRGGASRPSSLDRSSTGPVASRWRLPGLESPCLTPAVFAAVGDYFSYEERGRAMFLGHLGEHQRKHPGRARRRPHQRAAIVALDVRTAGRALADLRGDPLPQPPQDPPRTP